MKYEDTLFIYEAVINSAKSSRAIISELKEPEGDLSKKDKYPEGKPILELALKGGPT